MSNMIKSQCLQEFSEMKYIMAEGRDGEVFHCRLWVEIEYIQIRKNVSEKQ